MTTKNPKGAGRKPMNPAGAKKRILIYLDPVIYGKVKGIQGNVSGYVEAVLKDHFKL